MHSGVIGSRGSGQACSFALACCIGGAGKSCVEVSLTVAVCTSRICDGDAGGC